MYCYIYGAGEKGKEAIRFIRERDNSIIVKGFIDKNKTGKICGIHIYNTDVKIADEEIIIIAIQNLQIAFEIFQCIRKSTNADVYWFSGEKTEKGNDFLTGQCECCNFWDETLWQAEVHLVDACNLNCRGCTHYSPIFENMLPVFSDVLSDVEKLKTKFSHVFFFYLLGGEPFLNPEIGDYAVSIRKILSNTEIIIVTNGLLIPKADELTMRKISISNVKISISEYYPTSKLHSDIKEKLEKFNIRYEWRELSEKQKFNKPLSLSDNSKYKRKCISNSCVNIWKGKIARCPQLMYIDKFNSYFGTELPNQGIMSLDDELSGKELLRELKKTVPLCNHCIENEIEWSVCGKNVRLEDFAAMD